MIWLTRIDGEQVLVNDDQILYVEAHNDTILSLHNGDRLRVQESPDELAARIAHWRRRVLGLSLLSADELERED